MPRSNGPTPLRSSRRRAAIWAATLATAAGALTATTGPSARAQTRRVLFSSFSSCPKFLNYVQTLALPLVGPYGLGGGVGFDTPVAVGGPVPLPRIAPRPTKKATSSPQVPVPASPAAATTAAPAVAQPGEATAAAAPASADGSAARANGGGTSTTNVQEAGVDEGDEVETDGRYVYTAIGQGAVRILDTTSGTIVATLPAFGNGQEPQLILDGTRLAVTRTLSDQYGPETVVELWSVLNPGQPQLLGRTHLEGNALAVRSVDHRARIVLTTGFGQRLRFVQPQIGDSVDLQRAVIANRRVVKQATANDWLPRIYDEDANGSAGPVRPALDCREIGKPTDPSGLGVVWVATVDLDTVGARRAARGSGGVVTDGGVVYSSATSLVVATIDQSRFPANVNPSGAITDRLGRPIRSGVPFQTALHEFDLRPVDGATYLASGEVPGTLLNQFSMSEYNGILRVASTTQNAGFGSRQESGVHLFARNGRSLDEISSVTGIGRNEQIYGVRFLGDLGYVVTFRQTDPLFVIDLRDPRAPRLAGQLKIPGYSAYLHPLEPGYILGVGQDATDGGRRLGTMLQVFDVRNPDNPQQVARLRIGGNSEAEYDHHAFLYWAATRNAFVPTTEYNQQAFFSGMVVANVGLNAVTEKGRVVHDIPFNGQSYGPGLVVAPVTTIAGSAPVAVRAFDQIRRALIVNGRLVTVGYQSAKVSDLDTLKQQLFTTFQ